MNLPRMFWKDYFTIFKIRKRCLLVSSRDICALKSENADKRCRQVQKNFSNISRLIKLQKRSKSSSLYISDEDYTVNVSVDIDLNLDRILASPCTLKQNLKARNISLDVDSLVKNFELMNDLKKKKSNLERERKDIAKRISELKQVMKQNTSTENENFLKSIDILKSKGQEIKHLSNEISEQYWRVKENVIYCGLKIPNQIHTDTSDTLVLKSQGQTENFPKSKSHVEIGSENGLIKFSNIGPKTFYLKGELAVYERTLINMTQEFLKQNELIPISPPDIVRSVIIEGCGFDLENNRPTVLTLQDNERQVSKVRDDYHLQGTSLQSLVAYLMRQKIQHDSFPLKYYSLGRRYVSGINLPGLFGAHQYTNAVIIGACQSETEVTNLFQDNCEIVWKFLNSFDMPIRQVTVPASKLFLSESLRYEFQIWSPNLQEYLTIGYLSCYDDFISRRLMCVHDNTQLNSMFVHMIGGEVINITRILALMLEYNLPLVNKHNVS